MSCELSLNRTTAGETHQQRHDELVQVDHLDAAHAQPDAAVRPGGVAVAGALGGVRSQTHVEAEHLVAHDGDRLKDRKNTQGLGHGDRKSPGRRRPSR